MAPTPSPTPTPTPTPTPKWELPNIEPKFDGPGVAGLASFGSWLAGAVLVLAIIAIILGAGIAAIGPRLKFHGATALGMGGIIGGLAVGGIVALATPGVAEVGSWFS